MRFQIVRLWSAGKFFLTREGDCDAIIIFISQCQGETKIIVGKQDFHCDLSFGRFAGKDSLKLIYEGAWLNDEPYGVIHRLATNGKQKGVSEACLDWCFERWPNVRVDTHRDNKVMQHILTKYGFQRCGIIYVKNGTERIAYQMKRLHGGVEESDRTEV